MGVGVASSRKQAITKIDIRRCTLEINSMNSHINYRKIKTSGDNFKCFSEEGLMAHTLETSCFIYRI
jgi:SET domain-containing protein